MSVVFINYALETFTPTQSGAIATIIHELCLAAQKQGHKPLVISQRAASAVPFDDIETRFIDYPRIHGRVGTFLARADRRIGGWRHLGHRTYAHRIARELKNETARPWVLFNDPETAVYLRERYPHAFILHWFQNLHDCKPQFRSRFAAAVTKIVACSQFTAEWAESFYGCGPGKVGVLHNGVNTGAFLPAQAQPNGPPIINFVGRTGIEKGPDILLRAALKLSTRGRKFGLQLLGSNHWDRFENDDYQRELRTLAEQLERGGVTVRRPGHVNRWSLPGELQKAHIHVVPARWDEPFGMTTIEGMACGLATIASRTGGTPEVVGDAALLFEREDEASLAAHLDRLLGDESLRKSLSTRGRQRAMEFDWSHSWDRLRAFLT